MNRHRFFLTRAKIQGTRGFLGGAELEHMRRVLRLRPGHTVMVFDDEGWEHEAVIHSYSSENVELEIRRSFQPRRESPLALILAQALGKGQKVDWVVEKATELGMQAILPFVSSYTVPRLSDQRFAQRKARWEKVALSAVKQSGRTRVPGVMELLAFQELVERSWPCDLKLLFTLGEGVLAKGIRQVKSEHDHASSALLVIGPEGGFTAEEITRASARGFLPVHLGKRTLRTETAAVAAIAVVQLLWGDMA